MYVNTRAKTTNVSLVNLFILLKCITSISYAQEFTPCQQLIQNIYEEKNQVVQKLLQNQIDPNCQVKSGQSPLLCAASSGNVKAAKLLLHKKTNPNISDTSGKTALMYATMPYPQDFEINLNHKKQTKHSFQQKDAIIKLLINAHTDINQKDKYQNSPLLYAVKYIRTNAVHLLIKAKANINQQNIYGYTPLMHAVINNDSKIVDMLLQAQATTSLKNKEGKTALDLAKELNKNDIIQMITRYNKN